MNNEKCICAVKRGKSTCRAAAFLEVAAKRHKTFFFPEIFTTGKLLQNTEMNTYLF
jgi:hypothetical protein